MAIMDQTMWEEYYEIKELLVITYVRAIICKEIVK
jgi:hypothetical protein